MTGQLRIAPETVAQLFAAAAAKGILGGKREAVLARLDAMAADLFPDGTNLFSSLMRDAATTSDAGGNSPRAVGAGFWRSRAGDQEVLRHEGRYYTPEAVIDRILGLVWDDLFPAGVFPPEAAGTVCDPAMGCGFFLLRLVEKIRERFQPKPAELRRWAAASLYGVDMDPNAVFMGRALLWLELSDRKNEFVPSREKFVCGEALLGNGFGPAGETRLVDAAGSVDWATSFPEVAARGGFGAIVGNPPYEVLTNFQRKPASRRQAKALRASGLYRDSLEGQINLYRCFIERSLSLLQDGGTLSLVVPLSLVRDASAARLRKRLLTEENASAWLLYQENDGLFPGVTQSACIFRARRGGGEANEPSVAVSDAPAETLRIRDLVEFGPGGYAIPALDPEELELWRWFKTNCPRTLAEYADCHVGEVDQTFYRECMADEPTGCLLARGAHVTPFRVDVENKPGKERYLRLERFLEMKKGVAEKCRRQAEAERVAQLGIRNMQSRPRLVAAVLPAGVYAGNSLNIYYPRAGLPINFLAGMLNSRLVDWLFRISSGNNNINLHEMRGLPFPELDDPAAIAAVAGAYADCAALAMEGEPCRTDAEQARMRLDQAAAVCYRLPNRMLDKLLT